MDIKYHVEIAWKTCISHMVSLIVLTLVMVCVSIFSIGILAPVAFAGYTHSVFQLLISNRKPRAKDIFSHLSLFLPLFLFTLTIFILTLIGFTLFVVPGILFTLMTGYVCLYMIPIMVDDQVGVLTAIKRSIAIVTRSHFTDHLVVFLIFFALTTIGGSSFIGFLFLQPFATVFLLSAYRNVK